MAYEPILLIIRAVQALFAIIVLGLTAYGINVWDSVFDGNYYYRIAPPSQISFLLFCAIWTFLVLAYLILTPRLAPTLAHKFIVVAVEAITMIFWFAGFIALAVLIGPFICNGESVCSALDAASAFGAFEWLLFAVTTGFAVLHIFREHGNSSVKPAPAVSASAGV